MTKQDDRTKDQQKELIKKAKKIDNKIGNLYNELNPTTAIGGLYHDSLYYQNIGAGEDLREMVYCYENNENVPDTYYNDTLENLEYTLKHFRAVLQMQKIESKMNEPIYG